MYLLLNIFFVLLSGNGPTANQFENLSAESLSRGEEQLPFILLTKINEVTNATDLTKSRLVYRTEFKAEADKIVFITPYKAESSLIVYETKVRAEVTQQKGIWFWTKFKHEADWKIYFTNQKTEANLILCYTKFKSEASSQ